MHLRRQDSRRFPKLGLIAMSREAGIDALRGVLGNPIALQELEHLSSWPRPSGPCLGTLDS